MSNATTRRPALNIPLIVLWVASVGVAAFGFWFLLSGNAAQADFYNTQGSDYLEFLNLQTQSTIGGMLLTAGVIGVFIALATHARNWAAANVAASQMVSDDLYPRELDEDEDDGFDVADLETHEEQAAATPPVASEAADIAPEATATETTGATATEPDADEPPADEPKDSPERA